MEASDRKEQKPDKPSARTAGQLFRALWEKFFQRKAVPAVAKTPDPEKSAPEEPAAQPAPQEPAPPKPAAKKPTAKKLAAKKNARKKAIAKPIKSAASKPASPAEVNFEEGGRLVKEGKIWQAVNAFEAAVKSGGAKASWFFQLGDAHEQMNRFSEAAAAFASALELDPKPAYWHYRLGFACERAGWADRAAQAYSAAIECDQKGLARRFGIGVFHQRRGFWELAAAAYAKQIKEDSEATLFYRLGLAYDRCYRWSEAVHNYREAIARDFTQGPWHARLGFALERLELWDEAAESYARAVARPGAARLELYYRLGATLAKAGRQAEAVEALLNTRILRRAFGVPTTNWKKDRRSLLTTSYLEYSETLPVCDNVILYESYLGSSINCNPHAIFRRLLRDPAYKNHLHVWSIAKGLEIPADLRREPNVIFVNRESTLYVQYLATAKWLINNTTFPYYFTRRPEQKYLNTWHGTPLKAMGRDMGSPDEFMTHANSARNFLHATHLITPNEHTTRILLDRYEIAESFAGRVALTGFPRIDVTLKMDAASKQQLRRRLGLVEDRPVVLYAPTWRGQAGKPVVNVDRLKADCMRLREAPAQFLFRGHHFAERALKGQLPDITVVPSEIDTYELLAVVDVLITDYSSIFFDFLATGRPVVHYLYDLEEYQRERGKLYLPVESLPGPVAMTIDSLLECLPGVIAESAAPRDARYTEAAAAYCPAEDGAATERTVRFFFEGCGDWDVRREPTPCRSLLFYPGAFIPNGITSSALNLLSTLNPSEFTTTVAVDVDSISRHPDRRERFSQLPKTVRAIGRIGHMLLSPEESWVRSILLERGELQSPAMWEVYNAAYAREFRRVFGDSRWDVEVDFEGYNRFWSSLLAPRDGSNSRHVIYLHNDMFEEWSLRFPSLAGQFGIFRRYHAFVSVSEAMRAVNRESLSDRFGLDRERFQFCPNMIKADTICQKSEEALETDLAEWMGANDSPVFINIARLSPEKDQDKLLHAFALVRAERPDIRLLILGGGPLESALKMRVHELGLEGAVMLAGARKNAMPALKRASCFVLSSNHEGQPMVLLEAMLLGKPIIATDIHGNRGLLSGRYGKLVENSVSGVAEGLKAFLEGADCRGDFSPTKYREEAMQHFRSIVAGGLGDQTEDSSAARRDSTAVVSEKL